MLFSAVPNLLSGFQYLQIFAFFCIQLLTINVLTDSTIHSQVPYLSWLRYIVPPGHFFLPDCAFPWRDPNDQKSPTVVMK